MLVTQSPNGTTSTAQGLAEQGFTVVASYAPDDTWTDGAGTAGADIVVIDTPKVDERLLAQVKAVATRWQVPIALFSDDDEKDKIFAAVEAGVNAFFTAGPASGSLRHAIDVAFAQFNTRRALLTELDRVSATLAERKVVERAKGIVMKTRALDEAEAYRMMRQVAMSRNIRLAQLAEVIIEAEELLKT